MLLPLLLALPVAAQDPSPSQGLATLEMKSVEVQLPHGHEVQAERGMLWVPILRANPKSKKIGVDVWRFRARSEEKPTAPPVFILHGGPGWGGMEPHSVEWDDSIERVTRFADCIVVGQRGIGTSSGTPCDGVIDRELGYPDAQASEEERVQFLQARCMDCREHWLAQGYDLSGFNVIEAAGDVSDVSRILGYDQISLWGTSFGSHWGMAIMRFHPGLVARSLLGGMEGPDHTYDSPSGVLDGIKRMAAAADASPRLAEHIPEGGLIAAFSVLIDAIEADPFELEVTNPSTRKLQSVRIDGDALRSMSLGLGSRVSSRRNMPQWPAIIIRMLRGDFEPLARSLISDQGAPSLPSASFFMLDCGSGITPGRLKRYLEDPAIKIVDNLSEFYINTCSVWNADLGDEFRSDFVSEIPTVVVQGLWDVSTPFSNALECIPLFSNLKFIAVDGGSHNALGESMDMLPGFAEGIFGFLETGSSEALPDDVQLPEVEWILPSD